LVGFEQNLMNIGLKENKILPKGFPTYSSEKKDQMTATDQERESIQAVSLLFGK